MMGLLGAGIVLACLALVGWGALIEHRWMTKRNAIRQQR